MNVVIYNILYLWSIVAAGIALSCLILLTAKAILFVSFLAISIGLILSGNIIQAYTEQENQIESTNNN